MAPELMKQSGYGRKVDIWSLKCLIEVLCDKPLWDGVENQLMLMMKMIVFLESPEIPKIESSMVKDFMRKFFTRDPNSCQQPQTST